jgi:hypothetical protein
MLRLPDFGLPDFGLPDFATLRVTLLTAARW